MSRPKPGHGRLPPAPENPLPTHRLLQWHDLDQPINLPDAGNSKLLPMVVAAFSAMDVPDCAGWVILFSATDRRIC